MERELQELAIDIYGEGEWLEHYGTKRHSGRYPWGSGDDPYQRDDYDFLNDIRELREQGLSESEIAKGKGMTTTEYRKRKALAIENERKSMMMRVNNMREHGASPTAIANETNIPYSTVLNLLKNKEKIRETKVDKTANILKAYVDENRYIDIGPGNELYLQCTDTTMKNAVAALEKEGYTKQKIFVEQLGTDHQTTVTVLCSPDVTKKELFDNRFNVKSVASKIVGEDGNIERLGTLPPRSVDSSRIQVVYAEQGGVNRDGLIELRRGVNDISLGAANYAQVRIAVDDTHYLKGMAVYADDLPPGCDIRFNTNKHEGTPMLGTKDNSVLKPLKGDKDNPFGATIKSEEELVKAQRYYIDENGKRQQSCINVVNEEGTWNDWSRTIASQMLSKQTEKTAKIQLDISVKDKRAEYEEIASLTNPVVKKKMLDSFASDCDATAVDLKASAFPKQACKVLLPFTDLKDNEIYNPMLPEGTEVCLIRYPHGGTFEIPKLRVTHRGEASKVIGEAIDAVGINANVAARLSGADFDGDTVVCIPLSDKVNIRTTNPLAALKDFDPKELYSLPPEAPKITPKKKQTEMGIVSNLITDMTLQGATPDELARAVKHSMVVIDAEKHHLDWQRSERENDIQELKNKYQNGGGASTIISRASSKVNVPETKDYKGLTALRYDENGNQIGNVNPETGELVLKPTGKTRNYINTKIDVKDPKSGNITKKTVKKTVYEDKDGRYSYTVTDVNTGEKRKMYVNDISKIHTAAITKESTKMAETKDAYTLTLGGSKEKSVVQMENLYANYANSMKALANEARKNYISTPKFKYNPEANKKYKAEVDSLNAKLNAALKNAPLERAAQLLANSKIQALLNDNPELKDDNDRLKKEKARALTAARARVGAKKEYVKITDKEWEAIQAGAISESKLTKILDNSDLDQVKKLATPRTQRVISKSDTNLAKAMHSGGYSATEIADRLNISPSSVLQLLEA